MRVTLPERELRHASLASLWARGRIEDLMLSSPFAVSDAVRAEVTSLALSYRLMSPYTSFVAVDDSLVVNPSGSVETIHQALPMPEGVSYEGIFGLDKEDKDERGFKTVSGVVGGVIGGIQGGVDAAAPPPMPASMRQQTAKRAVANEERSDGTELRQAAIRVLADLADDGKLTAAEGRPALEALLAVPASSDPTTQALIAWALSEAPGQLPAAAKALDALVLMAKPGMDSEGARWARLVLGAFRPSALATIPEPLGEAGKDYARVRASIASAKSGGKAMNVTGHTPLDRLVATIGRGHLKLASRSTIAARSRQGN